jgi:hypothetical protein
MAPGRSPLIWNEIKEDSNSDTILNKKIKAVYQQYIKALVNNEMLP